MSFKYRTIYQEGWTIANVEVTGGADTYLLYGVESTYGTAVSATAHIGLVLNTTPKINRNIKENVGLKGTSTGGQETAKYTLGTADTGLPVEFNPFDWSIMQYVLGSRTGAGSQASPFIYTRDNQVSSLTFSANIDNDTTDRDFQVLGAKVGTMTIKAAIGEPVSVTSDWLRGKITKDTSNQSGVALPSNEIMNFTGADLEIPNASSISNIIDSIEIVINRGTELLYGVGSDTAKNALFKKFELRINFTVKYLDDTLIELVIGGSTVLTTISETTLTVVFDNGTNRTADFAFTGVTFPEYDNPHTPNEILTEGITAFSRSLIITEQIKS